MTEKSKKRDYKRHKGWCDSCDKVIVEKHKKCPVCNVKNK